ncbi:MAG: AAA family ATPase [archaeon]|jgi:chromosome segregation protein|nr:AAA family ATPase [archaeon]
MVKIQKLILKNFKSFKKAEVPIADGFTVIAGSNGSGKSNILDALLFSICATSLKTMRASRLTDLVNKGASENYAKVDLHLKHDGKKYEISRMIDKQGKCVYRLDGNRITRNEMSSLLAEIGIRPDSHNIVMQGDVTRIVEMSPEERRQIVDELAGLQEFDEKKAEALNNLEKVENKIRDTNIVLQERENYLQDLEKEREHALQFESLEKEKKKLKATLLFSEIEKIKKRLNENAKKTKEFSEKLEQLRTRLSESTQRAKLEREKARELNQAILAANEKIFSTLGSKLEEKRSEIRVLEERLERKSEIISRNETRTGELKEKERNLVLERKRLADEKAEISAEGKKISKELAPLQERKKEIEKIQAGRQEALTKLETEIKQLGQKIDLLKREEISKQGNAEKLKQRKEVEAEKLQELILEKEKVESVIIELEKKQLHLKAVYTKEKNPAETLEKSRGQLEEKITESKRKQALINSLEEKAALLDKQLAECPVCDTELSAEKKSKILSKTRAKIKEESSEIAGLLTDEKEFKERIKGLETLVFKEKELQMELRPLESEMERNKELIERIKSLKAQMHDKSISAIETEAAKAREQANSLSSKKAQLETKRGNIVAGMQLEELSKLNARMGNSLTRKKLIEQRLEQINEALDSRLEKESKLIQNETEGLESESLSLKGEIEKGKEKLGEMQKSVEELAKGVDKAEQENQDKIKKKEKLEERAEEIGEKITIMHHKSKALEQQENQINIDNSGLGVRIDDLKEEFENFKEVKRFSEFNESDLRTKLSATEKKVSSLGAINMKAIESFNELASEVREVRVRVEKLEEERVAVLGMIDKIEVKRTTVFMTCFESLNRYFSNTFLDLFSGEGLLSLSNPEAPLESGLIIEAKHKGNSLQNIDGMSGGEKTLTALAFLFAIQLYEPAPFYVFDEADAALDKENSVKMVKIIKQISKKSQFIAITHNDPLIREADQIIGVAVNKQKSSVIGLKLREKVFKEKKA